MAAQRIIPILGSFLETSGNINIFKMVKFPCPSPQKTKNILLKKSQYSVDRQYTIMPGKTSSFAALVNTGVVHVVMTRCFVHQYALGCKTLPTISPARNLTYCCKVFYCFMSAKP